MVGRTHVLMWRFFERGRDLMSNSMCVSEGKDTILGFLIKIAKMDHLSMNGFPEKPLSFGLTMVLETTHFLKIVDIDTPY